MQKIELYILQSQGKMITDEELTIFLSLWPEFNPIRLCLEIAAFVGLRAHDIINLKVPGVSNLEGFSDDFKHLNYVISKPRNHGNTIRHKAHHREIPDWLAHKLSLYFRNNIYTFKENRMFPFSADHIRNDIYNVRNRYKSKHPFLGDIWEVIRYPNGREQNVHRIGFHTLRSRAIVKINESTGSLEKTARIIGHTNIETTYRYIRFNNLKEIDRNLADGVFHSPHQPKMFISKDQARLKDFGITKDKPIDEGMNRLYINGCYLLTCASCGTIFKSKTKCRRYCSRACKHPTHE